jgi:hypothetical protein
LERDFSELHRVLFRLIANGVVIVLSIAVCLLLLEAGVRLFEGVPLFSHGNIIAEKLDQVRKSTGIAVEYESHVGWAQRPNQRWVDASGTYTTGEYGARMSDATIVPLQRGAILAVGDSFLAGSEVSDRDSWPARLEKIVGTQVVNLGVGGYGIDQSVLRAEQLVPVLKPRVLLVEMRFEFGALIVARMSVYAGATKPYFNVRDGKLVARNSPVPPHASSARDLGLVRSVLGYSYLADFIVTRLDKRQWWMGDGPLNKYVIPTQEALDVSCLLMERLGKLATKENVRTALVLEYSGPEIMVDSIPWYPESERVASCAQKAGVEVVDLLAGLRAAYKARGLEGFQKLWNMSDNNRLYGHMSAEGNQLVAELVAQKLGLETADQKSK